MKLFLDDQARTDRASWVPEDFQTVINFAEFKTTLEEALARGEKIEAISFDNDLADGEMDGWKIASWLVETHPEIFRDNPNITVHSQNPEGRDRIMQHIERGQKHFEELIEAKTRPDPWAELGKR